MVNNLLVSFCFYISAHMKKTSDYYWKLSLSVVGIFWGVEPLAKTPSFTEFLRDYQTLLEICRDGPTGDSSQLNVKDCPFFRNIFTLTECTIAFDWQFVVATFSHTRMRLMEYRYEFHILLNGSREAESMKVCDFFLCERFFHLFNLRIGSERWSFLATNNRLWSHL